MNNLDSMGVYSMYLCTVFLYYIRQALKEPNRLFPDALLLFLTKYATVFRCRTTAGT